MPDGSHGLLAAADHRRRVPADPARLRVHADRRRRPARHQPRDERRHILRDGVKDGTLDSILFPKDPRQNAPRDHQRPALGLPGRRGPVRLRPDGQDRRGEPRDHQRSRSALVLELPTPIRLVILGRVKLALPDPEEAVVHLQLDILGVIDFDKGEVSFDALPVRLADADLPAHRRHGDARRLSASQPAFALSAGGFQPALPAARPISRSSTGWASPWRPARTRGCGSRRTSRSPPTRSSSARAWTSSSTADLGAIGHSRDGHMGFDALLQFAAVHVHRRARRAATMKRNGAVFSRDQTSR